MSGMDGVSSVTSSYASYQSTEAGKSKSTDSTKGKTTSSTEAAKSETAAAGTTSGAVYESSAATNKTSGRVTANTSKADRKAIIAQLKADQESHMEQLTNIVQQMIGKQGNAYGAANDMWKFLASGKFTVDAQTKAQAQADIAEDGYYGVSQTTDRIFDFAMALSGGSKEGMEKMQAAFEKGFNQAKKTWGGELPEISQQTYDAVKQKFDDYYASLETATEQ
ncbi:MAG: hypothetical protein PHP50_00075 [Lachnospiraceae bacterium]|nr:hypothetical protein [Lachnospiraceae bacterium]